MAKSNALLSALASSCVAASLLASPSEAGQQLFHFEGMAGSGELVEWSLVTPTYFQTTMYGLVTYSGGQLSYAAIETEKTEPYIVFATRELLPVHTSTSCTLGIEVCPYIEPIDEQSFEFQHMDFGLNLTVNPDLSTLPPGKLRTAAPPPKTTTLSLRFESADGGPISYVIDGYQVVPEPGTWALMILGFGAAGVGLRRRRHVQA